MDDRALSVGLMVPANNTTMEPELLAWLPEGSSCRRIGIPRGREMLTPDTLPAYLDQAVALAKEFADDDIDLVVYGCTAAGFMAGPARDAQVATDLAARTRKRVITTASAMTSVLHEIGARNIALVTPYSEAVNESLRSFLKLSDIGVGVLSTFAAETVEELAAITGAQIAQRAREAMRPGIDAMFIACSQLPTHALIAGLERELAVPVWSSIRATAHQATQVAAVA